jgi:hypothetical protein
MLFLVMIGLMIAGKRGEQPDVPESETRMPHAAAA